jgi:hypothetical protein
MGADQLHQEQVEDLVLKSILLAAAAGLFGPTLDELLGRPEGHAHRMALSMLTGKMTTD